MQHWSSFWTGALFSDRHVITAGHCLMTIPKGGQLEVTVGVNQLFTKDYDVIKSG